jgi:hypothetical protein
MNVSPLDIVHDWIDFTLDARQVTLRVAADRSGERKQLASIISSPKASLTPNASA